MFQWLFMIGKKQKINKFNIILLIILFFIIFIIPHILQYQILGHKLTYDYNFDTYQKIKTLEGIILYLKESVIHNSNIFKNQIFYFFIAAYLYQKIFFYFSK